MVRTWEDRYRDLGHLFYSIACCDRSIVRAEIEALKDMIERHWLVEDRGYDELGVGSARYIDIGFDQARVAGLSAKEAFERFKDGQLQDPRRCNGWTKDLIMRTALEIARASGSVNRSEAQYLGALKDLLGHPTAE